MAQSRLSLQELFELIPEVVKAYFQPPETIKMDYPCIVYKIGGRNNERADDMPYNYTNMYTVTVIDKNPDSEIPGKVAELPYCEFDRFYTADNLNHTVYRLYY